ncbi:MAG: response regulator [Deltaproteobacteria bacterium]|nr:response regulator [Deltaproteobacteria bacterium]
MASAQRPQPEIKKILVIDDEPIVRQVLSLHLRSGGYDVTCAERAGEGLALVPSGSFSLVITDYNLPDSNGLEVLRAVKGAAPGLPVIMISGLIDAELAARAIREGAVEYMGKPFTKAAVLATVAGILSTGQG